MSVGIEFVDELLWLDNYGVGIFRGSGSIIVIYIFFWEMCIVFPGLYDKHALLYGVTFFIAGKRCMPRVVGTVCNTYNVVTIMYILI